MYSFNDPTNQKMLRKLINIHPLFQKYELDETYFQSFFTEEKELMNEEELMLKNKKTLITIFQSEQPLIAPPPVLELTPVHEPVKSSTFNVVKDLLQKKGTYGSLKPSLSDSLNKL